MGVRGAEGPSRRCQLPLRHTRKGRSSLCRVPKLCCSRAEMGGEEKEERPGGDLSLEISVKSLVSGLILRNIPLAQLSSGCAMPSVCASSPQVATYSNTHQVHFLLWTVAGKQLYISNFLCSLLFRACIYSWSMQSITAR